MLPSVIHLPDGQNFIVQPVFAGVFFQWDELGGHPHAFPIGWTVVLHTREGNDDGDNRDEDEDGSSSESEPIRPPGQPKQVTPQHKRKPRHVHAFTKPTLQNDSFFISSISIPSSSDYKSPASPTRQIAMIIWTTLYWYFHQPAPSPILHTTASRATPVEGKPRGEWRISIKRDGILRERNLIPKLERMGLLATLDSAVGTEMDDASDGWAHMFVSRRMFWQIPERLFLFTRQPTAKGASSYPGSPAASRPVSPARNEPLARMSGSSRNLLPDAAAGTGPASFPIGPYFSASHLPTYFPPPALQYALTNNVRHPIRPKPPRMGEVFYTRYVPRQLQYLSFRVASLSPRPVPYLGPVSTGQALPAYDRAAHLATLSDTSLLQMWMADPRVSAFWGSYVPDFLSNALRSRHSFPVISLWDGVPFGYFEIYWVREDLLGRHLGAHAADWDRGFHVLIGEEWARGKVQLWLSSMVHWILCADYRTMSVCLEPRVDNQRFIQHLQHAGFSKEREIDFPHKQAWFGRLRRDEWEGPAL